MNAALKPPERPTIAQLETDLEGANHELLLARRAHDTAKTSELPLLRARGDERGIAACRERMRVSAEAIGRLTERVDDLRAAIAAARMLMLEEGNRIRYQRLDALLDRLCAAANSCESSPSGRNLAKVVEFRMLVAEELAACAVPVTELQHLFLPSAIARCHELSQFLESGGAVGRGSRFASIEQLRASTAHRMGALAIEYVGVVRRVARLALHITTPENLS